MGLRSSHSCIDCLCDQPEPCPGIWHQHGDEREKKEAVRPLQEERSHIWHDLLGIEPLLSFEEAKKHIAQRLFPTAQHLHEMYECSNPSLLSEAVSRYNHLEFCFCVPLAGLYSFFQLTVSQPDVGPDERLIIICYQIRSGAI
jgi:hypothetical protein